MGIRLYLAIAVFSISLTGCGSAHKSQRPEHDDFAKVKSLAVVVKQEKQFEVVYNRAMATGASAALFGAAGAAITASIDEGKDKEKADALAEAISSICCQTNFSEGLSSLKQNGRFEKIDLIVEPTTASFDGYDAVVTFNIKQWGLRLIEQRQDTMAGFMEIDMTVQDVTSNKKVWDERQVVIGQGRESLGKYMSDPVLVQNELKQTIQDAGLRMSNRLIYQ